MKFKRLVQFSLQIAVALAIAVPVTIACPDLFKIVLVGFYAMALVMAVGDYPDLDWLTAKLNPADVPHARHWATSWRFLGFSILCLLLAFLEVRQPFYFSQDDNHTQFLPVIVESMRGFFSQGVFPTWDAYQNMGHPTASIGVYTLTYPFTYIAYMVARFLLGNDLYTIEVFSWMHFIAGYFISYAVLRATGARPSIAAAGTLCFVLCGFNLLAGRSWYIAVPFVVWIPALAWSLQAFERAEKIPLRWVLLTALIIGLAFHSGHSQLWIYAMVFWGTGILWLLFCKPAKRQHFFLSAVATGLLGLGLSMPLMLIWTLEIWGQTNQLWNDGIGVGLNNILLPHPIVNSVHPNPGWGIHPETIGALYYSGSVFFILFMARCACELAYLIKRRPLFDAAFRSSLLFSLLTVFSFWWALGWQGHLWTWIAYIPPLNNANSPFKFLPFIAFFSIMAAAPFLERIIRHFRLSAHAQCCIASIAIGLILANAISGKWPWMHLSDIPYPELPASMKPMQMPDTYSSRALRIIPYSPWRSQTLDYAPTMIHNYASFYHIHSVEGYNLAVTGSPFYQHADTRRLNNFMQLEWDYLTLGQEFTREHIENYTFAKFKTFLIEYGVRGALIAHQIATEPMSRAKENEVNLWLKLPHKEITANPQGDVLLLMKMPDVKPLVYITLASEPQAVAFRVRPNGLEIKLQESERQADIVIANFLDRKWFKAYAENGVRLPVKMDFLGRIEIHNTLHTSLIRVCYSPPWKFSIAFGIILSLLALLSWRFAQRRYV